MVPFLFFLFSDDVENEDRLQSKTTPHEPNEDMKLVIIFGIWTSMQRRASRGQAHAKRIGRTAKKRSTAAQMQVLPM